MFWFFYVFVPKSVQLGGFMVHRNTIASILGYFIVDIYVEGYESGHTYNYIIFIFKIVSEMYD